MNTKINMLGVIALSFLLGNCSDKKPDSGQEIAYDVQNGIISLTPNSNLIDRLKVVSVEEVDFSFDLVTAGVVKAIPNQYAEIVAPFSGRIIRSFITLGQKVNAHTPLFEVSSAEFFSAQRDYFDAKQEFSQAKLNLNRQKDLLDNGVGIRQEYEQAQTEYVMAQFALTNSVAALNVYHVDIDKLVLGQPLKVDTPIKGEIIDNELVIGQYVNGEQAVVKIASLEEIWVVAKVKEKDMHHLERLDKVQIEMAAYPGVEIDAQLVHISEIVDEETRSIDLIVKVDNTNRRLKPGMYVNVRFKDKPVKVVLVPSKAVLQSHDSSFVYIEVSAGQYRKQNIITAPGHSLEQTVALQGLEGNEKVVSEGGIYLPQM